MNRVLEHEPSLPAVAQICATCELETVPLPSPELLPPEPSPPDPDPLSALVPLPPVSLVVEVVAGDQELLHTQVAVAIARLLGLRAPTANQQKSDLPPEAETSYLLGRGYLLLGPEGLPAVLPHFNM